MERAESIAVEVVWCAGPNACDLVALQLPAGSTVADAVAASGLGERYRLQGGAEAADAVRLGVWSKPREAHSVLRAGDRVEIYRALKVDPKEARRQRYQQHKESLLRRELDKAEKAKKAAQITPAAPAENSAGEVR